MSPGAGLHITMAAGSITKTTGPGVLAVNTTGNAVGGDRHSSPSFHSTCLMEMRSAGIRSHITIEIHARVIITAEIGTIAGVDIPTMVTTIETIGVVIRDTGGV